MKYFQITTGFFKYIFIFIIFGCLIPTQAASADVPSHSYDFSGTLPVIFIETEDRIPITSKTEYISADFWLDPRGIEGIEAVGSEAEPLTIQIRGRGHSSWKGDKKPYKIKLGTKKSLLDMPENKHWALLKPFESSVAGFQLGKILDMAWTPSAQPVEVMLNGDYIGFYFLTETIRIDKNRVNIYEQEDQETDPNLISGGWLMEVDNYKDNCQFTIQENPHWNLTLRYHSPEDLSSRQKEWITNEFTSINSAIYSTDKTSTTWENYIDVGSMARYFIIQEVMDNPDGFHGSFYLHKDLGENSKWVAGPIWDLLCYNREKTDYTFKMKVHYNFIPHWIGEIIQYDSFCRKVKEIWNDVYPDKLSAIYDYIDETIPPLASAWAKDAVRWNDDPTQTAQSRAEKIKNALRRNIEWFNNHLPVSPYPTGLSNISVDETQTVKAYNLQGILIGEFKNALEAAECLKPGLYIIAGKKTLIP